MIPEWLLNNEEYNPSNDKNTFVDKSISTLLKILSKIRLNKKPINNRFNINPSIKILCTFLLVLFMSLSKSFMYVLILNVYMLLLLSLLEGQTIKPILFASFLGGFFTSIALIPSILLGNTLNSIMIILKVFATIGMVNILSYTIPWNKITQAFKMFHIPDMFILILDITIKYIIILGNFSLNMFYSLKLRSVGKNQNKNSSMSGIIGNMFLISKDMAEEMYSAMECRGFTGEYYINSNFKINFFDMLYLLIHAILILLFFYIEKM